MLVAVVSDIHSNAEALAVVLDDARAQAAEEIWCLGDIVGYGADPDAVTERIRESAVASVAGNHDWAACGLISTRFFNRHAAAAAEWTAQNASRATLDWLAALPLVIRREGIVLVHATPSAPAAWNYCMQVEDALSEMESYSEPVCLIGHSHYPGSFERDGEEIRYTRAPEVVLHEGRQYLINVGSVGQPRDGDPRAAYMLFDSTTRRVRHVRVPYDIPAAQAKILAAGLPPFLASRLAAGD